MKKVLVIGAGQVGAHIVQYGVARNMSAHYYLMDLDDDLTQAHTLDLKDTLIFSKNSKVDAIESGSPLVQEMDVIIITAGANQLPGETRIDLLGKNAAILSAISKNLGKLKQDAVMLLVANPVDVVTKLAQEIFDLPEQQVLGTGTLLDSARLRWRIGEHLGINVNNVHGYVLAEHGDSQFIAWSKVSSEETLSNKEKAQIEESVRREAYEIIKGKGSTHFGIAASTIQLLSSILNDDHSIYPVSTAYPHFSDESLRETPLGVPAVIGKCGVVRVPELNLRTEEFTKLEESARKLKGYHDER